MDSSSDRLNHRVGVVGFPPTDIPRRGLGNLNRNRTNNNLLVNNSLKFTTMATTMNSNGIGDTHKNRNSVTKSNDTALAVMQQTRCLQMNGGSATI